MPTKRSRICSRHFVNNKKSEHPSSPSFVPTIFQDRNQSDGKSASSRFDRLLKRQKTERVDIATKSKRIKTAQQDASTEDVQNATCDVGTQVDFLPRYNDYNIFICNRVEYNNCCTAETQADLYIRHSNKKQFIQPKYVDKQCGNEITYTDKCIGPVDDGSSRLKCTNGFHGRESISCDMAMLDLAGVTLATFQFLLNLLPENSKEKLSKENRLLLFLIKMKVGLTASALHHGHSFLY